jgi:hypothetical protein
MKVAADKAASSAFFNERVAVKGGLHKEKELATIAADNEKDRLLGEKGFADAEREHLQRLLDASDADHERELRDKAGKEADRRQLVREAEAADAKKESLHVSL